MAKFPKQGKSPMGGGGATSTSKTRFTRRGFDRRYRVPSGTQRIPQNLKKGTSAKPGS